MSAAGEASRSENVLALMAEIRACRICVERPASKPLPHEPRPVAVLSATARIAICGQAPGTRVHASGVPFLDPSGDRLRQWMGIGKEIFYDASRIAIVPMGFCFPGLDAKGSDLPPRKECAANWRERVFSLMPQIELMLVAGQYAQKWHLESFRKKGVAANAGNWRAILAATSRPAMFALPHPSWRNNSWIAKNPWFETELLPELRNRVRQFV